MLNIFSAEVSIYENLHFQRMNPYSTPVSEPSNLSTHQSEFKHVVIAWEKLRLLYNVILMLAGIIALFILINYYRESTTMVLMQTLAFAFLANVCFFAGPVCELYLRAFRHVSNAQSLRWILFSMGTIVSIVPAAIMITMPALYQVW